MRVLLTLIFTAGTLGAEAEPARVTVVLFDTADVPAEVLGKAKAYYSRMFEQAGFDVEWVHPEPGWGVQVDAGAVLIKIVAKPSQILLPGIAHCLGITQAGEAIVFYDEIRATAGERGSRAKSTLPLLLGHVLAHETGHLLISREHTLTGVMKFSWDRADFVRIEQGQIGFTAKQARVMRNNLQARARRLHIARSRSEQQSSEREPEPLAQPE